MTVAVAVEGDEAPEALMERVTGRLAELRAGDDAARRSRPGRAAARGGGGAAGPLRGGRAAGGREDPRRGAREGGAGARGAGDRGAATSTRRRCSTASGPPSPSATATAWAARRAPSWAPAPSCWCAATAHGRRPWRWRAPRAAAPIRPWTTTSASSCSRARRTGSSSRSWRERIERALDPVSVWVAAADEPVLVKVQNVQHLATPIRAQLARAAVGGRAGRAAAPDPGGGRRARGGVAEPMIPALEGLDRGWYAGAIGWTDLAEDGEFCVALRCALLRGSGRPPLRGLRDRGGLGARRGAGGDRGQAAGAAAAARLGAPLRPLVPVRARTPSARAGGPGLSCTSRHAPPRCRDPRGSPFRAGRARGRRARAAALPGRPGPRRGRI